MNHFPDVLAHCSDMRLIEMTCSYIYMANERPDAPWDYYFERAAMCLAECSRRMLHCPCAFALEFEAAA